MRVSANSQEISPSDKRLTEEQKKLAQELYEKHSGILLEWLKKSRSLRGVKDEDYLQFGIHDAILQVARNFLPEDITSGLLYTISIRRVLDYLIHIKELAKKGHRAREHPISLNALTADLEEGGIGVIPELSITDPDFAMGDFVEDIREYCKGHGEEKWAQLILAMIDQNLTSLEAAQAIGLRSQGSKAHNWHRAQEFLQRKFGRVMEE